MAKNYLIGKVKGAKVGDLFKQWFEDSVTYGDYEEEVYAEAIKELQEKYPIKLSLADRLKDVMIDYQYQPLQQTSEMNKNQLQKYTSMENQTEYAQYLQLVQKLQSHEVLYTFMTVSIEMVKYKLCLFFSRSNQAPKVNRK